MSVPTSWQVQCQEHLHIGDLRAVFDVLSARLCSYEAGAIAVDGSSLNLCQCLIKYVFKELQLTVGEHA